MTNQSPSTVRLANDPGVLIAAIPALLHFTPAESLVLVCVTGTSMVDSVMRIDLPAPEDVPAVVRQLRAVIANQNAIVGMVAVVIGDHPHRDSSGTGELPHRALVDELACVCDDLGTVTTHALWTERIAFGQTWRCYDDPAAAGSIPDPITSTVAAATTVDGDVTYPSREAFTAQLTADPTPVLDRRADQMRTLPPVRPDDAIDLVDTIIDRIDARGPAATAKTVALDDDLDDDTIVRLAQALTHPRVRDASLRHCLSARADAAEQLWARLTRATPPPALAHPGTLLALSAYLRGNGVLAGLALDIALAADPRNELARLLRTVLDHGMPASRLREFLSSAVTEHALPPVG